MMTAIRVVDPAACAFDIHRDLSVTARERQPGPPHRIDGMTVGIVTMTENAPHGGEVHPDGDEILYVISGRLRVSADAGPPGGVLLSPGDACIVERGQWHRVEVLEPTQLLHVTPGPDGDHRPVGSD